MTILIISLVLHIMLFALNKKIGFVYYQLFTATVYLISLSYIQTLDITLVIYLIFSIIPYIRNFKITSTLYSIILMYFVLSVFISVLNNGIGSAISIFTIRLSGLFLFHFLFSDIDFQKHRVKTHISSFKYSVSFLLCELIVLLIGLSLSTDGRLMLNYQCTVGCIATSAVLFLAYRLLEFKSNRIIIIIAMIALTVVACLSGTRGYILVSVAVTCVSIFVYAEIRMRLIMCLSALLIGLIKYESILNLFLSKLRMGESTGRRTSENLFVLEFMNERSFFNLLFGNGFGAVVGRFSISEDIIARVSDTAYTYYVLHNVSGFHNFWATILYSSGIVGLIMVIALYIMLFRQVLSSNASFKFKIVALVFLLSYAVLLWYRWTATSGILEFAMFAYILYDIKLRSECKIEVENEIKAEEQHWSCSNI